MNSKSQKLEPALKLLPEPKIEPLGTSREAERIQQEVQSELLVPMIVAVETRRRGISELKSPLSE